MSRIASRRVVVSLLAVASLAAALPAAAAEDAPAKRQEGRYFVNLAEILFRTSDFDYKFGTVDPDGSTGPQPAHEGVVKLPRYKVLQPEITMGLNRPSGKTQYSLSLQSFTLTNRSVPNVFFDSPALVQSELLPPGIVFLRQDPSQAGTVGEPEAGTPNEANQVGNVRTAELTTADITAAHDFYHNKTLRLRWTGGLRYAQMRQDLAQVLSFRPEHATFQGADLSFQDFFAMETKVTTNGLGPELGMNLRLLGGKRQRWSLEGAANISVLPETTVADYGVRLADQRVFSVILPMFRINTLETEPPLMPGLDEGTREKHVGSAYAAIDKQSGFSQDTYLAEGRIGFRYQASSFVTIGLDAWQMRWLNVLSQPGIIETMARTATYHSDIVTYIDGQTHQPYQAAIDRLSSDRFRKRQEFVFEGVSLNLGFEF